MADRSKTPNENTGHPQNTTPEYFERGYKNTKFQIKERPAPPKPIPVSPVSPSGRKVEKK